MNKIYIFTLINLIACALFSFFNICFYADISSLAFVIAFLYSAVIFYFLGFVFYKNKKIQKILITRRLLQYEPYVFLIVFIIRRSGNNGTDFVFDLICVLVWLCSFISSLFLSHYFDPKKFNTISDSKIKATKNESAFKMALKGKTSNGKDVNGLDYIKWFVFEILDWADALVQAVFMVLLFQIFLFQFYKIPSESMVPEFMINDRVAVSKITSGPKFPLSNVGLPCIKKYNRGDIVVFRNPHYTIDRKSEVKTVVSQIIYMLTFTLVNTNLDEHGNVKADPLVKRITGVPGEQLMMQDGILYTRTSSSNDFVAVTQDSKWAAYNLNEENPALQNYIRDFKASSQMFNDIILIENERNNLNIQNIKNECQKLAREFSKYAKGVQKNVTDVQLKSIFNNNDLFEYNLLNNYLAFAQTLIAMENGANWFAAFMTDWIEKYDDLINNQNNLVGGNLYSDSNYKLNLMIKIALGNIILKCAQNINNNISFSDFNNDASFVEYINKFEKIHLYCFFLDRRNMPVFPANDENGNAQYLPKDCYFMMGDNRFNSFDMRHTDNDYIAKLTSFDDYSVTYYSCMNPQYVPKNLILGTAEVRFWPLNRPVRNKK